MISVELDLPGPFPVGALVQGAVLWDPGPKARGDALQVTAGWHTEGRGNRDRGIVAELRLPFPDGVPLRPTRFPFRFQVPPDGPVSYNGHLLRIIWEIDARMTVSWGIDPRQRYRLMVVPRVT